MGYTTPVVCRIQEESIQMPETAISEVVQLIRAPYYLPRAVVIASSFTQRYRAKLDEKRGEDSAYKAERMAQEIVMSSPFHALVVC
jgi:hypothetical protein